MPRGDNKRKIGEAERAEMVRMYETPSADGTWVGTTTIAKRFGVSHPTVRNHLIAAGVTMRTASEAHAHGKRCKPVKNVPMGTRPVCKCGCGELVGWNQRKNRWNAFASGHYNPPQDFHRREWLEEHYVERNMTLAEMAAVAGVTQSTIAKAMRKAGIERRDRSASRLGRMVGEMNPAWRGGVADWAYSSDWKALARRVRDRDEWRCQDCGEQRKRWGHSLHVHHINGNKLDNRAENLVSLCAGCHRERHRQMVALT